MKTIFTLAGALLIATAAYAQETQDTVGLDPLVVTATRIAKPISTVPASVTVLDGDELRRNGVRTVDEALRTVSGAAIVQSGSYGSSTALFLRGGESDYVQVLIDGVQVNSPGEQFNWSNLTIENIERIEIVKGATSVLYGSDAVAGVVQLFTKQHARHLRGEASVAGGVGNRIGAQSEGAFGNGALRAELAGGSDRANYSFGVSHFGTGGAYAFNNQHRNSSVTARAVLRANGASDVKATLRYGRNRFHYPTDGMGIPQDRNQYRDGSMVAVGIDGTHRFSSKLQAVLALRHNRNEDTNNDAADNAADTLGFYRYYSEEQFNRSDADVRVNYGIGSQSLITLGTELEWQSNRGSSTSPFGDAPERVEKRTNRAAYAQWLVDRSRLSVQLGARAEDNDKFGGVGTYYAGASVRVTPELRLRASAGSAFKEPRFYEQFAEGFVIGNPELQPERSRSIEAGADASFGRARFAATWFNQKFTDLIQYVGLPASPTEPNYTNVAGADANGAEIEAEYTWPRLTLRANYTHLDTRVTDQGDGQDPSFLEGETLVRRPRHTISMGASTMLAGASVGVTANLVGARSDLDFATYPAGRITLPAYTRVDLAARRALNNTVSLTLKVENAFDAEYQEVLNFPALGRLVYVGAVLKF